MNDAIKLKLIIVNFGFKISYLIMHGKIVGSKREQVNNHRCFRKMLDGEAHGPAESRVAGAALCREGHGLALHDLGDVEVEEVAVEDGLHNSSNNGNDVIETLEVVAVDPIQDV